MGEKKQIKVFTIQYSIVSGTINNQADREGRLAPENIQSIQEHETRF